MKIDGGRVFFWVIMFLLLGAIFLGASLKAQEAEEKINLCTENNGVTRGNLFFGEDCINESGIYVIVKLNDEWKMIK